VETERHTDEVARAGGTGCSETIPEPPPPPSCLCLARDMTEGDHVDNAGAGEVDHSIGAFVFLEDGARVSLCVWECPLHMRRGVHSKREGGRGGRMEKRLRGGSGNLERPGGRD